MSAHGHGAIPAVSAGGRHRRRLLVAFLLVAAFFVVELVGGLLTGSLALLGDAGHMLTDVLGLGMALAAISVAASARHHPQRSFGLYRLEILAALANAALLLGVAGYVIYEGVRRLTEPPEVAVGPMLLIASAGLVVNIIAGLLLHEGAKDSLNLRGAYLEVLSDLLASVGVIVAGLVLLLTGWPYADPIAALAVGVFIIPRALRLGGEALRVLLQAAPSHLPVEDVRAELEGLEGVVEVHHLHVWTLTSAMEVVSAHIVVRDDVELHDALDRARDLLQKTYGVEHATLQVEPDTHMGCERVTW